VLPVPSRTGAEGSPRPYGVSPGFGSTPTHTARGLARAQSRALLYGPFPQQGLQRGISDGTLLLSEDANVRALAVRRIREAGATIVRIPVDWRDIAPTESEPSFQARDPASPGYKFAPVDAAVLSAVAAGLRPLLVVSHAPAFAEAPHRWPYAYPGSWAPSPKALEEFAEALAIRYDGSFPDAQARGGVLPRVTLLQAWNEPNLSRYLAPQWVEREGRWSAFSPLLYRQLLNAFYAGVKQTMPTDEVVAAGIAPTGDPTGVGRMAPVTFLEGMLCLAQGRAGRLLRTECAQPPHFDVLSIHPLSVGNPDVPAESSLDVSIADAAKVTNLLHDAELLHTALPAGRKPVWVTEINWESAPQAPAGVPPALQAAWVSRALHRLWVVGVSMVAWQFLVDPYPVERARTPSGGIVEYQRPAGLYSAGVNGNTESAQPKPFLQGFTLPFDPLRVNARQVRVWALLMRPYQRVVLERLGRGGVWRTVRGLRANGYGVLNALVAVRGTVTLRVVSGSLDSASSHVPRRGFAR
jgi:hypothetical protein